MLAIQPADCPDPRQDPVARQGVRGASAVTLTLSFVDVTVFKSEASAVKIPNCISDDPSKNSGFFRCLNERQGEEGKCEKDGADERRDAVRQVAPARPRGRVASGVRVRPQGPDHQGARPL